MTPSREFLQKHTDLLDGHGLAYSVDRSGKHLKLRVELPHGRCSVVLPRTPSDRRAIHNSLAHLRRLLRNGIPPRPWAAAKAA
jgi:hypothetical protein